MRALLWGGVATGAAVLLGALSLAAVFAYYAWDRRLPKISSLHEYQPNKVTRLYDRHGAIIGEIGSERRTVVPLAKIPKVLINAVLAAEDADFYEHRGLDYLGVLRAFVANLRAGRFVQGGSTITQQVVKTFLLSPERTIRRKVQELILARRLESELTKDEILYLYLNQIYFGHGRYGVQEAARFFFRKDVDGLGLAECALLAGLPKAPQRLSPLRHPRRAKQRQAYVLRRMAELDLISRPVAQRLVDEPIRVVRRDRRLGDIAPELGDIVRAKLAEAFDDQNIDQMGLEVHTTLDTKLQIAARDALRWGLRSLDARGGHRKSLGRVTGKARRRLLQRLERSQSAIREGREYRAVVRKIDDEARQISVDLGSRRVEVALDDERYNPERHGVSQRFKPGDVVRVRAERDGFVFDPGAQGALVAMDPRSGEVLAIVGGYSFRAGGFNRALRAARQPGSAFKPFVYAAALKSGRYSPATMIDDAPAVFKGWKPRNFDGVYRGPLRLRVALAHSINTVAVRLIDDVGVDPVRLLARQLGVSTELGDDLSLALGTSEVLPIDMVTAYSAIANGGKRVAPRYIRRFGGDEVQHAPPGAVLEPAAAYVLQHMMQSVVREGTARRAASLARPVAGKTGTTNESKDAWFVGFTPQLAAAVWVGFDSPRSLGRGETGGRAALPIWVRFMKEALRGKPKLPFAQPPGVVVQWIDPDSGLLAQPGAIGALEEVFIEGTEPHERAPTPEQVDPSTILMGPSIP